MSEDGLGFGVKGETIILQSSLDSTELKKDVKSAFEWLEQQENKFLSDMDKTIKGDIRRIANYVREQKRELQQSIDEPIKEDVRRVTEWVNEKIDNLRSSVDNTRDYTRSVVSSMVSLVESFSSLLGADVETKWIVLGLTAEAAVTQVFLELETALASPLGWAAVPELLSLLARWIAFIANMSVQFQTIRGMTDSGESFDRLTDVIGD